MLFSRLLSLPYQSCGTIDLGALREALPTVPIEVLEQVCSQHGRKAEFQQQYGHLDFANVEWRKELLEARVIVSCDVFGGFLMWFNSVSERISAFGTRGWKCVDCRPDVVNAWESSGTWQKPPVLIDTGVTSTKRQLHLVEGHTRIGTLKGLVDAAIVAPTSMHVAWVGYVKNDRAGGERFLLAPVLLDMP